MSESSPASAPSKADATLWQIEPGANVVGSCGHKIGEVMDVQETYFVVEQGFFICHDLYIPKDAISSLDRHGIHLRASKSDAKHSDWIVEPIDSGDDAAHTS
ncbi:MAG: hypothetical protein WKF81_06025 [Thermomicrobiales bacterium]